MASTIASEHGYWRVETAPDTAYTADDVVPTMWYGSDGKVEIIDPKHKCKNCRYAGKNCYSIIGNCSGFDKFESNEPTETIEEIQERQWVILDKKDETIKNLGDLVNELEMTFKAHLKNYSRKKRKKMIRYYGERMFQ